MHRIVQVNGGEENVLEPPWHAVYTKHQHEKKASAQLAGKGFEVFLPLYSAEHRWKDRKKVVSLPLFSCYLFVRTNLDRKLEILQTPGVFWLVESGGYPCAVPDSEIEAIRKITQSPVKFEPHSYLRRGDYVRIREGSLAGIEGVLKQVRNRYRVVLSVDLLQKALAVEVDYSAIERINRPADQPSFAPQQYDAMHTACN